MGYEKKRRLSDVWLDVLQKYYMQDYNLAERNEKRKKKFGKINLYAANESKH